MNVYYIEHKVATLLKNFQLDKNSKIKPFECLGLKFKHWDFSLEKGCIGDSWLVSGEIKAGNAFKAIKIFKNRLSRLLSRAVFVGQAYGEYNKESFLVIKKKSQTDIALLYYIKNRNATGLSFDTDEFGVVEELLENNNYEEFYLYWKDATNTTGYSGKLLLMFSAIESLCKELATPKKSQYAIREEMLGKRLNKKLFESNKGLRHRLVHGEYFSKKDGINFVEAIHKKVISYFNKKILRNNTIRNEVKNPQRHFFDNKDFGFWFIKNRKNAEAFNLKNILKNFDSYMGKDEKKLRYDFIGGKELKKIKNNF